MKIITQIALWLVIIGGLNWGLKGLFDWNLVEFLFGTGGLISRIIYSLVGISAVWLILEQITPRTEQTQK